MEPGFISLTELAQRFSGEWVLIGDPKKHKRTGAILSGRLLAHSPDRDLVYGAALEIKPLRSAFLCFKEVAEGHALVL